MGFLNDINSIYSDCVFVILWHPVGSLLKKKDYFKRFTVPSHIIQAFTECPVHSLLLSLYCFIFRPAVPPFVPRPWQCCSPTLLSWPLLYSSGLFWSKWFDWQLCNVLFFYRIMWLSADSLFSLPISCCCFSIPFTDLWALFRINVFH